MKQARELNIKTQFLGSAPMENPEIITIAGGASEGAIYPHHFDPDSPDPKVKKFEDEYRIRYGKQVEGYAALAYDGLYVIAYVIRSAGENRNAIKDSLYEVKNFPGVTGYTSFDDHGDVVKPIVIRMIKNGLFVTIWKEDIPIN
jgi:branched-chain amino acid transport system substrate-binding protein